LELTTQRNASKHLSEELRTSFQPCTSKGEGGHVGTCGFGNGSKISEYRVLWLQLSRLTQDLGNSMGMTFGAHIVVYFTGQVLFMYYILSMLSLRLDEFIVKFLIPVAISIYIYIVCNAAQSVTDEIGESFLECLETLEAKHPPKNAESDNEHVGTCGFGNGSKISEYRMLWLQLSKLTQDLGNSMGMTFGAHIMVYFTGQIGESFLECLETLEAKHPPKNAARYRNS
ncbi:hypothetical protein C0J52_27002, partial [Blattella germanica]